MHGIQGSKSIYWRLFLQMKPLRTFFSSRTNTTSSRFSSTADDTSSVDCVTSVRVAGRRLTEFCFISDWWSVTTDWGHWEMFSFVGRAKYLLRRWKTAGTFCPCLPQPRETPCYNKLNHECNIIVDCKSVLKKQLRKGFCIVSLRGTGRSHLYDYSLLTYKIDLDSNVHTWNPILYFDISTSCVAGKPWMMYFLHPASLVLPVWSREPRIEMSMTPMAGEGPFENHDIKQKKKVRLPGSWPEGDKPSPSLFHRN